MYPEIPNRVPRPREIPSLPLGWVAPIEVTKTGHSGAPE